MRGGLAVLLIEDDPDDAALMVRELERANFEVTWERVDTAATLGAALLGRTWDVCLSDYALPGFGAAAALAIVRSSHPRLPFIVVSGAIGEDTAVLLMREGADDYLLKSRLARLGTAVARAVESAAALHRSESRLEAILLSIKDGVVTTDADGVIVYFNNGAERIFGYASVEVIGTPVGRLVPERLREIHRGHERRFAEPGGSAKHIEHPAMLLGLRKTGEEFPIESVISRIDSAGGMLATVVIRDISERLHLAALEQQQSVLEEAVRVKAVFVASMNHELRTPLNAILGFSQLLLEQGDFSPKHRRYLENVADAGTHLLALVGDILDVARLESGKAVLRLETVGLTGLLEPVAAAARLSAEAKGITFAAAWPDRTLVSVDPTRVREMVQNLLSNAVKFTPPGGEVALRVRTEDEVVVLEVADNGVGIPLEYHDRVFKTFERFHEGVLAEPGTGLGLALVKQLVTLHGGSVEFESAAGVGTTFRIRLPVKPVPPSVLLSPAAARPYGLLPGGSDE